MSKTETQRSLLRSAPMRFDRAFVNWRPRDWHFGIDYFSCGCIFVWLGAVSFQWRNDTQEMCE